MTSTDCDLLFPCNKLSKLGGCWLALVQLLSTDIQKPGSPFLCSVTYIPLTVHSLTYHLMIPIWPLQEASKSSTSAEGEIVNLAKNFLDWAQNQSMSSPQSPVTSPHISASRTGLHSQLLCTEITWAWIRKMGLDLPQNVTWKKKIQCCTKCVINF